MGYWDPDRCYFCGKSLSAKTKEEARECLQNALGPDFHEDEFEEEWNRTH